MIKICMEVIFFITMYGLFFWLGYILGKTDGMHISFMRYRHYLNAVLYELEEAVVKACAKKPD